MTVLPTDLFINWHIFYGLVYLLGPYLPIDLFDYCLVCLLTCLPTTLFTY